MSGHQIIRGKAGSRFGVIAGLLVFSLPMLVSADEASPAVLRPSYGHLEHVRVLDRTPLDITASLNPNVANSLLYASDYKYFQRDSDTWVRFVIDNGSVLPGNRITMERPVIKDIHVRHNGGGVGHEPRVELDLCLGTQSFKTTLRLAPNNSFVPPLQLGSNDLDTLGTVDPQRKFTQDPVCVPPQKAAEALPPKT